MMNDNGVFPFVLEICFLNDLLSLFFVCTGFFLIILSSCEKPLSDEAVAKIKLTLLQPGIHPICRKKQNSFFKIKRL